MKRSIITLILMISSYVSTTFGADSVDDAENTKDRPVMQDILIAETLLAANAWMASEDPGSYGTLCGLFLFPFALSIGESTGSSIEKWGSFIGVELIALYNVQMGNDDTSKSEVFKNNMIAWHAVIGLAAFTAWLFEDEDESLALRSSEQSGIQLEYRIRF